MDTQKPCAVLGGIGSCLPLCREVSLSLIYMPQPGEKNDRAPLIELLSEVEAWRGDPGVAGTSVEERFSAARSEVSDFKKKVFVSSGLTGVQLQTELLRLMERADQYNEFGGVDGLAIDFRHVDRLLRAAGIENVFGKLRDHLWASIVEETVISCRTVH